MDVIATLIGVALASAMVARAFTRERLPFGVAAWLRRWGGMTVASLHGKRIVGRAASELYHLLTCPLCVSFWLVGAMLVALEQFSVIAWLQATGVAWIAGRLMGWENPPDNEV